MFEREVTETDFTFKILVSHPFSSKHFLEPNTLSFPLLALRLSAGRAGDLLRMQLDGILCR